MNIFKSALWLSLLSFTLSFVSFINQSLIASYFGAGKDLDLFYAASSIPIMIGSIINSTFSYSLTPHLITAKIGNIDEFKVYVGSFFNKLLIFATIICVFGVILTYFFLPFFYPEFVKYDHKSLIIINLITWISTLIAILFGFYVCIFNANEKFISPLVLNFIPYLSTIVLIHFLNENIGIITIPLGLLTGSLISLLISVYTNYNNISFGRIDYLKKNDIIKYFRQIPEVAVAMLCFTVYQAIDSYWAPQIGNSNLSYLGYCQRILIVIGTFVIIGPSTILIPRLTKAITENREKDFLIDTFIVVKLIFALASLFAVIASITAISIIEILFERGKFSHQNTLDISIILPYMLVGMIFMLCVVMLFRALFIKKMNIKVAFLGIGSSILYFSFSGLGVNYLGIKGIGISYILTWIIVFFIATALIFRKNCKIIYNSNTLFFIAKQIFILIIVAFLISLIKNYITKIQFENHFLKALTNFLACSFFGVICYVVFSIKIFKLKEIEYLINGIFVLFKKITWTYCKTNK